MAITPIDRLIQLSRDSNCEVKAAAAYALGESRCSLQVVAERLEQMTHDSDLIVKVSATKALGRLLRPSPARY
ncbi:TPA: HEAT repeat domain-containing protein [Morganella morganii]|nr:HEAT repeat domain-containing protein [Morganella morganii]